MRSTVSKGPTLELQSMIIIITVVVLGSRRISQRNESADYQSVQLPENTSVTVKSQVCCVPSCLGSARRRSASWIIYATPTILSTFVCVHKTLKACAAAMRGGILDILRLLSDPHFFSRRKVLRGEYCRGAKPQLPVWRLKMRKTKKMNWCLGDGAMLVF
ncbi:hypothetical protein MRX96_023947 [Rhipicephalus microplus]